jgi:hypothetical protein
VYGVSGLALENAARHVVMAKRSVSGLLSKMHSMVAWNARVRPSKLRNAVILAPSIVNGKSGQNMVDVQKSVAQVKRFGPAGLLLMPNMVASHAKVPGRRPRIATKRNAQLIATSLIGSKSETAASLVVVAFTLKNEPSINRHSLVVRNAHPISGEMCLVIWSHALWIV